MKRILLTLSAFALSYGVALAQIATSLSIVDTRSTATTPDTYSQNLIGSFKQASTLGLPVTGTIYYSLIGFRGWLSDNTGGKAHELAFSDDSRIFYRSGNSPTWENWLQIPITDQNGNLGIGTTDTKGYKLAVNGSAIATSMKVALYGSWPDYVLKKDYQLPSLVDVKSYIGRNHHLPDMPSEQDVKANGIDLGETDKLLTKKIEELTLYLIDKDDKISLLEKAVGSQQLQIDELKKQVDKLLQPGKSKK